MSLQELQLLRTADLRGRPGAAGAPPRGVAAVAPPPPPPPAKTSGKEFVRRMPSHVLPPYVEANFRLMTFIMTRAPKMEDFPQERMYTKESLDLLFRHY